MSEARAVGFSSAIGDSHIAYQYHRKTVSVTDCIEDVPKRTRLSEMSQFWVRLGLVSPGVLFGKGPVK